MCLVQTHFDLFAHHEKSAGYGKNVSTIKKTCGFGVKEPSGLIRNCRKAEIVGE
jgi:hypothetical protein